MNICIVGGGNIGVAIAARIKILTRHHVTLCCSKPELWHGEIVLKDSINGTAEVAMLLNLTSNFAQCIPNADIVFVTYPSFARKEAIRKLIPHMRSGSILGFVPGCGGVEFSFEQLLSKQITVFGFDRVPCISRLSACAKTVDANFKESCRLATIPRADAERVCQILEPLLGLVIVPLKNYLTVTLTPSNPILHTSRLYSLFHLYSPHHVFAEKIFFYGKWDMESSVMLLECDRELQHLCSAICNVDVSGVIPLSKHYKSQTAFAMTQKLQGIPTLARIEAPLKRTDVGYVIDYASRYFLEDFPHGLCVIKGLCIIYGVKTPKIDQVIAWYQGICGKEYFVGDTLGRDIYDTSSPQAFGLCTVDDVGKYYNR